MAIASYIVIVIVVIVVIAVALLLTCLVSGLFALLYFVSERVCALLPVLRFFSVIETVIEFGLTSLVRDMTAR